MVDIFSFCRIPPRSLPLDSLGSPILYRSKATYDGLTRSITIAVWVGILAIVSIVVSRLPEEVSSTLELIAALLATVGVSFGVLLGLLPFSPRSYELTLSGIVIRRIWRSFEIPYTEIEEAKRINWSWAGIRLYASGGLYGYFGLFKFRDLGRVWVYVTNRHNVVLLRTRSGTQYMLSPEDPEAFLEKLKAILAKMNA